jgi:ABC-2 type transport system ATP-binding protein
MQTNRSRDRDSDEMTAAIEIKELNKSYGGRVAVDGLNLTVETGEVFGFVGPNGAGKTSTIRILAGLLRPTSGEVSVAGYSVSQSLVEVKRRIGYMPDFFGVYPDLSVQEYLDFFSACYQIPEGRRSALIDELLELMELSHRRMDRVDQLSRGLKQRLSLARTLIHDPQVLLLDEPAAGLDPRARIEIRELLVELARMGKTVFFSTHILSDVAEICNRVGIIEAGKLVAVGGLEQLHLQVLPRRQIELTLLERLDEAAQLLEQRPNISQVQRHALNENSRQRLTFEFDGDDAALSQLLSDLVQNQIPVLHFSEDARNLEDVFMRTTQGIVS